MVATSVLSLFSEDCLWDIAQTDVQTVEWTIQTFNISVEIVSIFSVDITIIINELIAISCFGQPMCSGRGNCVNARCVCDEGYQCFLFSISQCCTKLVKQ